MDEFLPKHLQERIRWVVKPDAKPPGDLVVYWMHHAVRAHENPALDVAVHFSKAFGLPLLVYHAISEDYPYASDRHHAFIMQGARDVQREFQEIGVSYRFHLQRDGNRGPHLRDLARRAAMIVTDEMPLAPVTGWIERLSSITSTPIVTVDTTCLVPVSLVKECHTRAFEFRRVTRKLFDERLAQDYPTTEIDCQPFQGALTFESIDLQQADLRRLIGLCRIDHTVAPVADSPGGSRAGYARWQAFKQNGLSEYEKRRNDAADHRGVSRMSAYMHYGMVSPFRIAKEAVECNAVKFLDELLVWREMAFHFCSHHQGDVDTFDALPDWARRTLIAHQPDSREANHSWETLARARTENQLWDASQRCLLKHGELHNNLRMTWGKAFLNWTDSPGKALHLAIDLNHRYALDGRDPSSYGGLLWCFGQFDRPFPPEQPVFGSVRTRSIELHEKRIEMKQYLQVADRPVCAPKPRIAIIGAGLAGIVAGRTLADHGLDVRVFDKSRGSGGRMATRRTADGLQFDHGAQYFTSRDERFTRHVQSWVQDGLVQPWHGRIVQLNRGRVVAEKNDTTRYVPIPSMNALAKSLAEDLPITLETPVKRLVSLEHDGRQGWRLQGDSEQDLGVFDLVIVNCPPPQAVALLQDHSPIANTIAEVEMLPCWASMIQLNARDSRIPFDAAFVDDSPLSWICRNDTKPGRATQPEACWVLHASSLWSKEHLETDTAAVESLMHQAFCDAVGISINKIVSVGTHRWRYAIPATVLSLPSLWDSTQRLGACGDWCGGPRIEGAYLSGAAMAGDVLRDLTIDRKISTSSELAEPVG